ncbi:helix-turn-helix domain-containing protein [Oceanispirochaeta sp.]|jgi:cytoskeleton protein RodZ|uniref:helix-turn-helix domain-containing protein n=1 Tax=Oceanispirochaeta sp. TaxID=2035350 RepID=UPI002634B24C|nr:helix-turn-helix domain-containing protein [Oceanispirochaeta sp.]MDA3957619.1 helix-turn-helix domain-containing protein [Oceanispirochaeta sp.]
MKSIGDTLREARETKGVTVKQVSQDTNISREYLSALEDEQFDAFPAETYLLGFLRNYSEYLGLDTDKTVAQYKNYKISEEPAPLEELVGQPRGRRVPVRLIVLIFVLAVLGLGGWFSLQATLKDRPVETVKNPVREALKYRLDENVAQWNLHSNDEILISYEKGELHMVVSVENKHLSIQPVDGGSELILSVGDEKILPGGDGIPVIGFRLSSLDENGAMLIVERTDVTVVHDEPIVDAPVVLPVLEGRETILLAGRSAPEDFTLNTLFNGYCLFRYQADDGEVVEKFYRDGDRIRLDVSNSLLLSLSSGGDVSIKISGVGLVPGKIGEVAVKFIKWVKNDEGKYDLVLFPVQ